MTWLEGHSLAQTVFTNLYLHNPYIINDRCLKAFSIVMLKIVDVIRERINRAGCFEEVCVGACTCVCVHPLVMYACASLLYACASLFYACASLLYACVSLLYACVSLFYDHVFEKPPNFYLHKPLF